MFKKKYKQVIMILSPLFVMESAFSHDGDHLPVSLNFDSIANHFIHVISHVSHWYGILLALLLVYAYKNLYKHKHFSLLSIFALIKSRVQKTLC